MLIEMAERQLLPDRLVRFGIRRLLRQRLNEESGRFSEGDRRARLQALFAAGPIAVETDAANEQHYEVPATFYQQMLGPNLKYSSCLWGAGCASLGEAEAAMLQATCERAELADGQRILELGCGWGSLTLWMAAHFPASQIVAVSNSRSQQEFIKLRCAERSLRNVEVRTVNVAELELAERFDRVVSVEMFEHMRNWEQLLTNVSGWLVPDGKCFLHTFCHNELFYPFADEGNTDWMARHFFSGGVMPSYGLLQEIDSPLEVQRQWKVNGNHYAKTCRAWLDNLDQNASAVIESFAETYDLPTAKRQLGRWRMFVMACEELFAYADGEEWFVSHALLGRD